MAQTVKNLPAMRKTQIQSLDQEDGYLLQYSCLENSVDRGAWWATVPGVAKSQTQQSDLHFHFFWYTIYCDRANILNPIGRKWGVNTCISLPLRSGIDKMFSSACCCLPFTDSSSAPLGLQGPQHCVNMPICSILPLLHWVMPGFRHRGRHLGPLGLGLLFTFPDLVWSSGVRIPICFRQGPLAAVGTRLAILSPDRSIRECMCYRTFRRATEEAAGEAPRNDSEN